MTEQTLKKTYDVSGLTCLDCAARLRASVAAVDGVENSQVDLAAGKLILTYHGQEPDLGQVNQAVEASGHSLILEKFDTHSPAALGFFRFLLARRATTLTALAAGLALLGLLFSALHWPLGATLTFIVAIILGGIPVAQSAWQELWLARSLGINTLMVIAVTGAVLIGELAEAAIVVVLFALGEALEGYAGDRARHALDSLLELAPATALQLQPNGSTLELGVERLQIGDLVLVRPGDRVSVDGVVLSGNSAVDQAPITGESIAVEKGPGAEVFAGTINGGGALHVEVTRLAADNTLSRMIALVQEAQSRQAPIQRFVDRFARIYTPAVTVMATLVATIPPLFLGQPFWGDSGWLMRALQMLVIACPCALVISTPVSVVSAMTNAASRGVLIKGGRYLDALAHVEAIAFDKTGTLTEGKPVATDILHVCTCGECEENCGLKYAASLETQSSHPLAQALLAEANARQLALSPAEGVAVLEGRGVEGKVNGTHVTVASHTHFDEHFPHQPDICQKADTLAAQGKTVVMVQHDGKVCGLFGVADQPRDDSQEVLAALKKLHIHTVMLTGDNATVANEIGRRVGVEQVSAELLPADKMAAIEELAREHTVVAMVGDGVNDAPALAQADVGIAMGGAGSDQAMETADIVLMGNDLGQLPFVVRLARRTRRIVGGNIGFALGVKVIVFALALTGQASLWLAILADVGASVAVILNGMRLRTTS